MIIICGKASQTDNFERFSRLISITEHAPPQYYKNRLHVLADTVQIQIPHDFIVVHK